MLFRTLEALSSHVVIQDSGSGPCLAAGTQSCLDLARANSHKVDEVCVAVLRSLPSHVPLVITQSCLSPSEALAYKVITLCNVQPSIVHWMVK